MQKLDLLKEMMIPIVQQCLAKHGGGESYFDELDGMIKRNERLLQNYLQYAITSSNCNNVIVSGEIANILLKQIREYNMDVNLICVNGGLRKGHPVWSVTGNRTKLSSYWNYPLIFFDDSYYSGKTAKAVEDYVKAHDGKILEKYVFYDGCPIRHNDVVSLYRYYE